MKITQTLAARVLEVVDAGLVQGVGKPIPGQMCVEAAVCFALGEKHGDEPSCVGSAVRAYKIRLNDAPWSSNAARTRGLRAVAIAQLGSDVLDQVVFSRHMALATVREILPVVLRARGFVVDADACAGAVDLAAATVAARAAHKTVYAAADAAYAAYAVDAVDAAAAAVAAAAAAAAAAVAAADAADAARDGILTLAARLCVRVLVEMKSPGVAFLELAQ